MENGGRVMNLDALKALSYGMFIITTRKDTKNVGCLINTVMQITSKNPILAVSINKENYTNEVLKETKKCAISILSTTASMDLISKFGYSSSRNTNKFENRNYQNIQELPVIMDDICGYIIGEVIQVIDAETHDIFLIRIQQTEMISDTAPMTYKYYQEELKGVSPKNAPTYQEVKKENNNAIRYQCTICGYIYDNSKEKINFKDVPDDWKCPICKVGKDKFVKL